MVVGFITIFAKQCLSPLILWVWIPLRRGVLDTTLYDEDCQWLATGRWFSLGTPVSPNNKTDHHNIAEVLLKEALNTINLPHPLNPVFIMGGYSNKGAMLQIFTSTYAVTRYQYSCYEFDSCRWLVVRDTCLSMTCNKSVVFFTCSWFLSQLKLFATVQV
jgi:hypothetical protein